MVSLSALCSRVRTIQQLASWHDKGPDRLRKQACDQRSDPNSHCIDVGRTSSSSLHWMPSCWLRHRFSKLLTMQRCIDSSRGWWKASSAQATSKPRPVKEMGISCTARLTWFLCNFFSFSTTLLNTQQLQDSRNFRKKTFKKVLVSQLHYAGVWMLPFGPFVVSVWQWLNLPMHFACSQLASQEESCCRPTVYDTFMKK